MNPVPPQASPAPPAAPADSVGATLRLWTLGGLSWPELAARTKQAYRVNHFDARSAQFAYYAMLAIFPLLILLIAALAALPIQGVLENALDAAQRGLPENVDRLLERQVRDIQGRSNVGLLGISSFLLVLAGTRVFLTLTKGLDTAYGIHDRPRSWLTYARALLLTVAAALLIVLAMVLMVIGPVLAHWIETFQVHPGWLEVLLQRGVRWVVVTAALWISISTVYHFGPSLVLPWHWLSPGCAVATAGCIAVSQGCRLYVENMGRFNETYGTLGGVIMLIVWLDMTGAMLFLGGQINAVIHRAEQERSAPRSD